MTSPASILAAVHLATGCEPSAIVSKSRRHSVLFPRYIALLMLRESRPFHSDNELGESLGIAGHGTTRHALGKAFAMLEHDAAFFEAYSRARTILNETP